jgi:hypothetical protein
MKKNALILTALVIAIAAIGCKKSSPADDNTMAGDTNPPTMTQNATAMATNAWDKTKEATTNAYEEMKSGATNAWAEMKDSMSSAADYTYDKKEAYLTDATNDLAKLDQRIQDLSDRAATASDNVKADAQTKLQELRAKRAALDQKMDDVRNSTEANWNDVKTAFQTSYDDVKTSVKTTWQWLKDKMSQ